MAVIDADTHVDECEETWLYMPPEDARYKPTTLVPTEEMDAGASAPGYTRHWLIGGGSAGSAMTGGPAPPSMPAS